MAKPPSEEKIRASLDKLSDASNKWLDASTNLTSAAMKTLGHEANISEGEVGLFTDFYNEYKKIPGYAYFRMTEGAEVCKLMSTGLKNGHDLYQKQEEDNRAAFNALY
ncbi:hypothetical protein ACFXO9_29790 [Nocardia tengchongensis]|uniref:hypothetical protein n=1 Tax=Nocardia tengchongensis TaxID=2055889 RepID=UPI0036BF1692